MPLTLTRTVGFRATHRLYRPDWSEARNREAFGALSEAPGHAHDYRCAVTVAGPIDPRMAMVLDLAELDRILQEEVVARLDGKHLNQDVPSLAGTIPTCEAIAQDVFRHLLPRLPRDIALERVRIMEDPTLYADCTGLD
ncbi:MAG TPA: 6-carboxytetrahydropterin synthase [Gemmatimonadales bacterium]|jgi:6-pyruvoyltetrahydropterin/6-carboxytetrahydropterin synthase